MDTHLLTWLIFSPLLALIPLLLFPSSTENGMKTTVFAFSLIPFGLAIRLFAKYYGTGGFEFQEIVPWLQGYQIYYRLGVDGFSMPLMVLASLLVPLVILSSWHSVHHHIRGYLALFIFLEVGMMGVFASLDLFLFYVFWEAQLIPMYFLIGKWGGERRVYAAIKFVLYTMVGSLLMLAAIMYLYYASGKSLSFEDLLHLDLPLQAQRYLFLAFALAFAIKVPVFPFHTWLPDAHVEAPTGGSVILAGILLKMGTYGLVRFVFTLFPQAAIEFIPVLQVLAVVGVVYGSLVAMVQPDIKKLVAYTSVAHLGFVVLGFCSLTAQGVAGANLQSINHGISTGALFFLVGMIYERRHTKLISEYGGLASVMPLFTFFFMVVTFSSIALPTTNGFVGEFLILLGSFKSNSMLTAIAATGVILGAVAMLWMVKRVFFGAINNEKNKTLQDMSAREVAVIIPLIILIFAIGVAPGFVLKKTEMTVTKFVERFESISK